MEDLRWQLKRAKIFMSIFYLCFWIFFLVLSIVLIYLYPTCTEKLLWIYMALAAFSLSIILVNIGIIICDATHPFIVQLILFLGPYGAMLILTLVTISSYECPDKVYIMYPISILILCPLNMITTAINH